MSAAACQSLRLRGVPTQRFPARLSDTRCPMSRLFALARSRTLTAICLSLAFSFGWVNHSKAFELSPVVDPALKPTVDAPAAALPEHILAKRIDQRFAAKTDEVPDFRKHV